MRRPLLLLCVLSSLIAAGCGGDDGGSEEPSGATGTAATTAAAAEVDFPKASEVRTARALREGRAEGAIFAPAVSVVRPGENRIGFALFDTARKQVEPDAVALYVSEPSGRRLQGPFVSTRRSLAIKPQYMSRQAQADLDQVDTFWTSEVSFPKQGRYVVTALAQIDGQLTSTSQYEMRVGASGAGQPPDVGDAAVRVSTDTVEDAGGDLASIDTREPPLAELHAADLADVLGKQPVVLAFATPQLCQTRVCGPVVDVVAQVRGESPVKDVAYIHQEIYVENDLNKGFRPQVGRWRLPTEPWIFLIGRDGRVVERFEGAVSVDELREAVDTKLAA